MCLSLAGILGVEEFLCYAFGLSLVLFFFFPFFCTVSMYFLYLKDRETETENGGRKPIPDFTTVGQAALPAPIPSSIQPACLPFLPLPDVVEGTRDTRIIHHGSRPQGAHSLTDTDKQSSSCDML